MYSLINRHETLNRGEAINISLNRLMGIQEASIKKIIDFYRKFNTRGPSSSPIIKILYSMTLPEDKTAIDYYNFFRQDLIPSVYGLTGEGSEGIVHEGTFYGSAKTIILAESKSTISEITRNNWQDLQPLKVVRHPGLKQSIVRPDLAEHGDDEIAILYLDTGILGYMYGQWVKINNAKALEERERPEDFISRFVYPNMLWSQFTQVMFNALVADYDRLTDLKDNHSPTLVQDKAYELVNQLYALVEEMGPGTTYEQMLENIPSLTNSSIKQDIVFPEMKNSLQTDWALTLSSLPMVTALSKFCYESPRITEVRNLYRREERRLKMQNIAGKVDDKHIRSVLKEELGRLSLEML
ncbi:hypothetical protein [Vibrio phage BONAISHI]|nr:hypothetical protein [Vibrio phage BONAISHI]